MSLESFDWITNWKVSCSHRKTEPRRACLSAKDMCFKVVYLITMAQEVTTAEVCEWNKELILSGQLRVLQPIFKSYGRHQLFSGRVVTVKVFEDNVCIRELLEEKGNGRVLVIDGGGSLRCAILGGNVVVEAYHNGWAGIVVNGCIRDVDEINITEIGVKAINSHPGKANKRGIGQKHVPVTFAGTRITDGEWLYADTDGVLVCNTELTFY